MEWLCFPFPIKDSHLDIKFKCRLCHKGAQELLLQIHWLLFTVPGFYVSCFPLNYLSRASVLHYLYVMSQQKWENGCFPLAPPLTASRPAASRCLSCLSSLSSPAISLSRRAHSFLLGGWVKPASSQLRDDRQSQVHLKIRPIDLSQKLHSNPDCLRNLYCRQNLVFQPPKYQCRLYLCWNPRAQNESELPRHHDYLISCFRRSYLELFNEPRNSSNNSTLLRFVTRLIHTRN